MSERLGSLLVPVLILLASIYASIYVIFLPTQWSNLLPFLPFTFAGVAVLLSWHFNKGRVFLVVLLLLIAKMPFAHHHNSPILVYLVFICVGILLLNFAQERGFFNRFAINRILFATLLLSLCYLIEQDWLALVFLQHTIASIGLSWGTLLLWITLSCSAVVMACLWWLHSDSFRASSFSSLISLFVISYSPINAVQFDVLLSAQLFVWIWFLLMESHRMAYLDEMTRLPGRRALNEKLIELPKQYAIAMVDVDHFKQFNDRYGHDMGDEVLKRVALQLRHFSKPGKAFRYGGEEFTVVFQNQPLEDMETVLETLRATIEAEQIDVMMSNTQQAQRVNVTVSIGLALAAVGESPETVLKRADDALYHSKKKGRNRITVS